MQQPDFRGNRNRYGYDFCLWFPNIPLLYSFTPKNACTTLKYSLMEANGTYQHGATVHSQALAHRYNGSPLPEGVKSVIALRDPFSRLASAYYEKLIDSAVRKLRPAHVRGDPRQPAPGDRSGRSRRRRATAVAGGIRQVHPPSPGREAQRALAAAVDLLRARAVRLHLSDGDIAHALATVAPRRYRTVFQAPTRCAFRKSDGRLADRPGVNAPTAACSLKEPSWAGLCARPGQSFRRRRYSTITIPLMPLASGSSWMSNSITSSSALLPRALMKRAVNF